MKITLPLFLFCFLSFDAFSQKEWSNWFNTYGRSFTFRNGSFEAVHFTHGSSIYKFGSSAAPYRASTYADNNGVPKLIFNGVLFNSAYDTIKNYSQIQYCDLSRPHASILPFPSDPNKFYLLSLHSHSSYLLSQQSGLQVRCPAAGYLKYSVVDLSLNNGKGEVTQLNQSLLSAPVNKLALVKDAGNTLNTWIVTHGFGTNNFTSFKVTAAGIQPGINSAAGPVISGSWKNALGFIVASPDGKKIAGITGDTWGANTVELYDFNAATGAVSNYTTLVINDNIESLGDVVFSPDNSKLYISATAKLPNCGASEARIYQADFNAPDLAQSLTLIYSTPKGNAFQFGNAPDGSIYFTGGYFQSLVVSWDWDYYMGKILYPNYPKQSCIINDKFYRYNDGGNDYFLFPQYRADIYNQPAEAPPASLTLNTSASFLCSDSITITAPAGYQSYKWNTGATGNSIKAGDPGTYYVLAGNSGFVKPLAFGTVKITSSGMVYDLGRDSTLCPGNTLTYQLPSSYTSVVWQDGTTGNTYTVLAPGGKIKYTATDASGCRVKDSACINFNTYPAPKLGNDTILCNNATMLLKPIQGAWSGTVFLWQNGSTKDTFRVTQPGQYWVRAQYGGCTVSDTIHVGYVSGASVNLGNDTVICTGESLTLQLNIPGASYLWSNGTTQSSTSVNTSGKYWVRVNNGSCTATDTINVTVQPKPVFTLGADTSICEREKLVLRFNIANAGYQWQDASVKDSMVVTQAGLYWLQVNVNGCKTRDSISVGIKPVPPLNLGKDTAICTNSLLFLNAAHPSIASYSWSNGSIQSSIQVITAGNYNLTVTGTNNCINRDTVYISQKPLPVFSLGADTSLCNGETLQYTIAENLSGIEWSNGSTSTGYAITQAGLYWVVLNNNGCIKRDSLQVDYRQLPVVSLGKDTTICEQQILLLDAYNPQSTYAWQDGSAASSYAVSMPGTYRVKVTMNNCVKSDTIEVHYQFIPKVYIGKDTTLCTGDSFYINATFPNADYVWQNGSDAAVQLVTKGGLYNVTVSNHCGAQTLTRLVKEEQCETVLWMPNAFSPNNDGINDLWKPRLTGQYSQFKLVIFNRWGRQVHQSFALNEWDGKFNGNPLPVGLYYCLVEYLDIYRGIRKRGNGSIMLVR
jgi:gliding motility-associated-like protein